SYTLASQDDSYLLYSQTEVTCDFEDTRTPFGGDLSIGASVCSYDDGLLPITILAFEAIDQDDAIELTWRVNSEEPTRQLHLQKSYDGVNWESVYEQNLEDMTAGQAMDGGYTDEAIEQS